MPNACFYRCPRLLFRLVVHWTGLPSVKPTSTFKHDQQVRSSLSGTGPCLLQVCKCFVTLFWITRPILTIFSIQNSSVFTRSASGQKQTTEKRVEMTEDLRSNLAKRAPNMLRHHCHGFVHVLIQSSLIKSDTNGGYHEFLGMGCGRFRSNRLWPKDCKRVFLRLFRSCTLPKCFSTTSKYHVQPTTTIMWDWNNVYGIGESYHYDFIQLITVESLVDVKMASNCQIVPLAPEKIVVTFNFPC